MAQPQPTILCLNCGKPTRLTRDAPHKKFCSAKCRIAWHNERRRKAMAELSERETNGLTAQIEEQGK